MICAVCGEEGSDRRMLHIRTGYDLTEVSPKFELDGVIEGLPHYKLFMCKDCRGDLQAMLRAWLTGAFIAARQPPSPKRNIPYRQDGRTVMLTFEEWEKARYGS